MKAMSVNQAETARPTRCRTHCNSVASPIVVLCILIFACNDASADENRSPGNESPNKVITNYDAAIRLDPKNARAYFNRGNAWRNQGNLKKAIADYDESIRLNSNYAAAYANRALTYYLVGEYDKAKLDYDIAIRLDPRQVASYISRGVVHAINGDYDRAIDDFTKGIALSPDCVKCYVNRAKAWAAKREYERAISDVEKAVQIAPHSVNGLNALAWRLATCPIDKYRDTKRAIATASKACEISKWENVVYLDTLAVAYAAAGDFPAAIKLQEKVIELAPDASKKEYRTRLQLYTRNQPYYE